MGKMEVERGSRPPRRRWSTGSRGGIEQSGFFCFPFPLSFFRFLSLRRSFCGGYGGKGIREPRYDSYLVGDGTCFF